jgi:hypothetical protein
MNAQFLVFASVAAPKPEDGWTDGVWKLTRLDAIRRGEFAIPRTPRHTITRLAVRA